MITDEKATRLMHKDITKNLMDANLKEIARLASMNIALEQGSRPSQLDSLKPALDKSQRILYICWRIDCS